MTPLISRPKKSTAHVERRMANALYRKPMAAVHPETFSGFGVDRGDRFDDLLLLLLLLLLQAVWSCENGLLVLLESLCWCFVDTLFAATVTRVRTAVVKIEK